MASTIGLEIFYRSVSPTFKGKKDAFTCFLHWKLVQNGFKCLGIGEKCENVNNSTEMLPDGWNESDCTFKLCYELEGKQYGLKIVHSDDLMFCNLMRLEDQKVQTISISLNDVIGDNYQEYCETYIAPDNLSSKLQTELVNPLLRPTKSDQSTSTEKPYTPITSERNTSPNFNDVCGRSSLLDHSPLNPLAVGGRDLDPFYGGPPGSGGMLMDPRGLGRMGIPRPGGGIPGLPRGAVPPGARFDPFGPPNPNHPGPRRGDPPGMGQFGVPDPDHLPPPPGFDDMFS